MRSVSSLKGLSQLLCLASVAVGVGVPGSAVPAAQAVTASCHRPPNTHLLTHKPTVTRLPGGAQLRVWDSGGADGGMGLRLSEVYVPAGSPLHLRILTSGALTTSKRPTRVLRAHKTAVAISNGDIFFPSRGALPQGDEVVGGRVDKAIRADKNVTAISKDGQLRQAMLHLTGEVVAGSRTEKITGLNWQTVWGKGVNVYTAPWGRQHRPAGSVDVVVRGGIVVAKRHSGLGRPPRHHQQILTGTGGAAAFLNSLRVGEHVAVRYGYHTKIRYDETPINVWEAINHDAPWLLDGKPWPVLCTVKNETHLARTALGWDRRGDVMLVTASGPDHGRIPGGATAANMEYYLEQLGAYNADAFDCDTSTTLAVRTHTGGPVHRIDRTDGAYERPVPNYLALTP